MMIDHTDLIANKNKDLKHYKLLNAGLIIVVVLLTTVIVGGFLLSRIAPPSLDAHIDVLKDTTPLQVPEEITSGEAFSYKTSGFKNTFKGANGVNEAPTAHVKLQYTCELGNGKTSTFPFLDFYSNTKGGKYNVEREVTIPVSARVKPADRCYLESYSEYKLFITHKDGATGEINFIEKNRSNYFKLKVKPVETDDMVRVSPVQEKTTNSAPKQMTIVSTTPKNLNVAQSTPPREDRTTSQMITKSAQSDTTHEPEPRSNDLIDVTGIVNELLGL